MKIAITQRECSINDITYDCLEHGWFDLLKTHDIIPVPNLGRCDFDFDMLIISGGDNSHSRFQTEVACFNVADRLNLPILGICHGAFFLNTMYGGINGTISGHQNREHLVTLENQEITVNSYHTGNIAELGIGLEILAHHNQHIEAFNHKSKPQWGIVWHPERMEFPVLPKAVKALIYG